MKHIWEDISHGRIIWYYLKNKKIKNSDMIWNCRSSSLDSSLIQQQF